MRLQITMIRRLVDDNADTPAKPDFINAFCSDSSKTQSFILGCSNMIFTV